MQRRRASDAGVSHRVMETFRNAQERLETQEDENKGNREGLVRAIREQALQHAALLSFCEDRKRRHSRGCEALAVVEWGGGARVSAEAASSFVASAAAFHGLPVPSPAAQARRVSVVFKKPVFALQWAAAAAARAPVSAAVCTVAGDGGVDAVGGAAGGAAGREAERLLVLAPPRCVAVASACTAALRTEH
eukprot:Rhum_TRINITY_DN10209_c1_g1::Rhum_TRINITY_DN10209_c1_g1_i1::g.37377::m.37377